MSEQVSFSPKVQFYSLVMTHRGWASAECEAEGVTGIIGEKLTGSDRESHMSQRWLDAVEAKARRVGRIPRIDLASGALAKVEIWLVTLKNASCSAMK